MSENVTENVPENVTAGDTVQGVSAITIAKFRIRGGFCILPLTQIVLGATWHNDCPRQPFIPVYLEVMGAYILLLIVLSFLPYLKNTKPHVLAINGLLILFFLCWFIAGNVTIYSIYEPNYRRSRGPHCSRTLYQFAFWAVNATYIQLALAICCYFCCKAIE